MFVLHPRIHTVSIFDLLWCYYDGRIRYKFRGSLKLSCFTVRQQLRLCVCVSADFSCKLALNQLCYSCLHSFEVVMVSVRLDAGPGRVPELEGQPVPLHGLAWLGHIQALYPPLEKLKNSCYCNSMIFWILLWGTLIFLKTWYRKYFVCFRKYFYDYFF